MRSHDVLRIAEYIRNSRYRRYWQKLARGLACIVVFCTTYALILPAITMQQQYFCGLEEHTHAESCYEETTVSLLTCTVPEISEHIHDDACYEQLFHVHDAACYDAVGEVICMKEEGAAETVLRCDVTEPVVHTHCEACFTEETQQTVICGLTEHTHDLTCSPDSRADVETEEQWTAGFGSAVLTGDPNGDTAAIARTQIGYTESSSNYLSEDGETKQGYTRYGAWRGTPYGAWSSSFVQFCMHYAHVTEAAVPYGGNPALWLDMLMTRNLVLTLKEVTPAEGMPSFYKTEDGNVAVGIVHAVHTAVGADGEVTGSLRIIAGDVDGRVAEVTAEAEDVLGLVDLTVAQQRYEAALSGEGDNTDVKLTVSNSGGVMATAAGNATLQLNITAWSSTFAFAGGNTVSCQIGDIVELRISNQQATFFTLNLNYSGCELVSAANTCDANHYHTEQSWCDSNLTHIIRVRVTASNASVSGDINWLFQNNSYKVIGSGGTVTPTPTPAPTPVPTPEPTPVPGTVPSYPYYPHAVHTGTVDISRLRFYNLCEDSGGGVRALAGCVFEVKGENGYTATVTSNDSIEVHLPEDIPDGTYTITEVSAPAGYLKDTEPVRTFEVRNSMLVSDRNIGTFINHDLGLMDAGKTAEVEDYNNRIYQILLDAEAHMKMYEMDPVDVLFVVDQSNSMLFPSGLVDTGKRLTLNNDGTNNLQNIESLNLDKSRMYYMISDPEGSATVWALWYNGHGWLYQDASYYAKAKHDNALGYQADTENAIFPECRSYEDQRTDETNINNQKPNGEKTIRSNGGAICDLRYGGRSFPIGGGLSGHLKARNGTDQMVIYTATNEFNRLHYLEEAMANMIYELADMNDENRVTLVRFTATVNPNHCMGPLNLTPDNADRLVSEVSKINTDGGTRQDVALQYTYDNYLGPNFSYKDVDHCYTILITDGAPALSGSNSGITLGNANSAPGSNTVYGQAKSQAERVRRESTLMTVGLGMTNVEGGKALLQQIATNAGHYCALDDAAQLVRKMQELMFRGFRPKAEIPLQADLIDEISESFYPIAWTAPGRGAETGRKVLLQDGTRDWILLQKSDFITADGRYTTAGAWDAAGQLLQLDDGTYYIRWADRTLNSNWNGTFYVKAKEDFIGGNAIDTNKNAYANISYGETFLGEKEFDSPTVNVRLLNLNEMRSEVTVYLGDTINHEGHAPIDSLRQFYADTLFTKLISDNDAMLHKLAPTDAVNDGLEIPHFYLRYALGRDLTDSEWQNLQNGETVTAEYIYDNASSHGAVGYFTIRLEKTGISGSEPAYGSHTAKAACQPNGVPATDACGSPAETYTLQVTYTAYRLNEGGRPAANVHNGAGSPGTQVGTGSTVETGLGRLTKNNVHEVHVISGMIEITKRFAAGYTPAEDVTFTFLLHRIEDGDHSKDITKTITVPAGQQTGTASIVFDHLPRGTYVVTEAPHDAYRVKEVVVSDATNCYYSADTAVTFVMGSNTANENVIGRTNAADIYTSYVDPVNGVYGRAEFVNEEIVYTGELPVKKLWDDGAEIHAADAVYLVLYLDGAPYLDGEHRASLLRLDAANNWQGNFTVVLADKNDVVSNYNYSVREVSAVSSAAKLGWHEAIVGSEEYVLYYEEALDEKDLINVNGRAYMVYYGTETDGTLVVSNDHAIELPNTGGVGTHWFKLGGALLLAGALTYGCALRRGKRREAKN